MAIRKNVDGAASKPSPFYLPKGKGEPPPAGGVEPSSTDPGPALDAPKDLMSEAMVTATDAFFEHPVLPLEPEVAQVEQWPPPQLPSPELAPGPAPEGTEPSPLENYVRELQQEYEEEEQEGKL